MNTRDGEQLASKDPHSHHPVATNWRPTLREVVRRLAGRDFALQGITSVEPVSAATAAQIEAYVADYGETLIELPEEAWATSVAQWGGGFWDVFVDLWTAESGRSDMVLEVRVLEVEGGLRFHVHLVYVP